MIVIDISFLLRTAPPGGHDRRTMTRLLAEQDRSLNAEVEWGAGGRGGEGRGLCWLVGLRFIGPRHYSCRYMIRFRHVPPKWPMRDQFSTPGAEVAHV